MTIAFAVFFCIVFDLQSLTQRETKYDFDSFVQEIYANSYYLFCVYSFCLFRMQYKRWFCQYNGIWELYI